MAEENGNLHKGVKRFSIGRGFQLSNRLGGTASSGFGSGVAISPQTSDVGARGRSLSLSWSPSEQFLRVDVQPSGPDSDNTANMVGQLGERIVDSIVARLMSSGLGDYNVCSTPVTDKSESDQTVSSVQQDMTPVIVHVKTERDPVVFRGHSSDIYSVLEWIGITKADMRMQSYSIAEQAEEIQGRLLGKARDVVTVALRNDDTLDVNQNPDLIYDILIRYFGQSLSALPLQDFYTSLPKPKENPVDYWIRSSANLTVSGCTAAGGGRS